MGTNSRGMSLSKSFSALPNVEVAYICDPDEQVLAKTVAEMEKITGKRPATFKDVRKLLEVKDLDGLAIAAPDHWHAPAAIMALQAGKNVYVEKPCSHNPNEGEMLVAAAAKYRKAVQMGNQRRSYGNVIQMMDKLHNGIIGRVYFARGWYTNSRKSIGRGKQMAPPSHLDFDLWQGPAPRRSYQDNLVHYNWHWFWHWGTGESLNNGTHMIDIMRWGMKVDYPVKVVSAGGRFHFQDDWETPDTQTITFTFANNTAFTWEGRSCNGFDTDGSSTGVVFYGDNGTLVYNSGNSYKVYDPGGKLINEVKDDTPFDPNNKVSPFEQLDLAHIQNFCDTIRGKASLHAPINEGHISTLLPQLGNIAYRTGRALNCDPANGRILNDAEALKLWRRDYEKGWEPRL
jgi:predicted dehydrogenase